MGFGMEKTEAMNIPKPMTIEEATRAIYEATNNMRWRKVDDSTPDGAHVLVWVNMHLVMWRGVGRWWHRGDAWDGPTPTHWMPLPPAPNAT